MYNKDKMLFCVVFLVTASFKPSSCLYNILSLTTFLYRQSVSTRLLAGHHARVVKVGQVTGECVWRSITVRRIVEEAAAPTPTATTLDLDR